MTMPINPVMQQLPTYPAEALYAKRAELQARGLEVFDFSVGDPIDPTDGSIQEAFRAGLPAVCRYPKVKGLDAFRHVVSAWLQRRFAIAVDPETEILPSSGSKEAIFHLPLAFCDTKRRPKVLYGVPAYPIYERSALFAGGEPWPVELRPESGYRLEPWTLDPSSIEQTSIIWINYPHNPTGATIDAAYLEKMAAFCEQHQILLASDECYVDMYFGDERPPSILQIRREGVLAFHSLSKRSGMTGYRSGFIAGDPTLIATLGKMRGNLGTASTTPVQKAAIVAWNDEQHAAQRRELLRKKRDLFVEFFARVGIKHLPCLATLYLWIAVPEGKNEDAEAYAAQLADEGILLQPASYMGVDQPYLRLALVPSLDDCKRAIAVWEKL